MWIDAGSRAETDETNGTAHFLEHLAFKVHSLVVFEVVESCIEVIIGHKQEVQESIGTGNRKYGWPP